MSDVLLIIHILGAGTWIGAAAVMGFMGPRMPKVDAAFAAGWQRVIVEMGTKVFSPAAIVVLVTGFGLIGVSDDAYGYGDAFVLVGIGVVVISAFFGIRIFGPRAEKAAEAYETGDRVAGDAIVKSVAPIGMLDTVLLIVAVTAMVMKWGVSGL